ncbi:CG4949 [Drosophila busckii]|uniref:CG4949 n=1 Tax=Drosophila busckii TaxID=30019 RepID=A0A0M4EU26_DROBS|nr:uncharacterized protein LOC108606092 isoform X1 [Drosophila busckii]ALC49188.1 CG4949 [Drosophila busckii]
MDKDDDDKRIRNHIILAPNEEYKQKVFKFMELSMQRRKKIMLLTQKNTNFTDGLQKQFPTTPIHLLIKVLFNRIEQAPTRLAELSGCTPRPDVVIFDMESLIGELLSRPILQQWDRQTTVRLIARLSAAFSNYSEVLHLCVPTKIVDCIVIMPKDPYPLTATQFRLLYGLYFIRFKVYTSFDEIDEVLREQHERQLRKEKERKFKS